MWQKLISLIKSWFAKTPRKAVTPPPLDPSIRIKVNRKHYRNVQRHIKIANACRDAYEKQIHITKAQKLMSRYNFPPLHLN